MQGAAAGDCSPRLWVPGGVNSGGGSLGLIVDEPRSSPCSDCAWLDQVVGTGSGADHSRSVRCLDRGRRQLDSGTVFNVQTGVSIAESVRRASGFFSRLRGMSGPRGCQTGLWLTPCGGIHTIGLRVPIDVVFIDRKGMVRKIEVSVPPFRIRRAARGTHSVLELPAGYTRRVRLRVGDRLSWKRSSNQRQ